MKLRSLFLFLALALYPSLAGAQSSPGLTFGQVPTPAQWNSYFASKADYLGSSYCPTGGCTMSGQLITIASTTANAGFTILPGVAPSAPVNGNMWMTSAGLFARVNGVTVGPFVSGTTSPVTSVSNSDSTLTVSPTTGAVVASLNLAHANIWTVAQTINLNAASCPAGDTGVSLQLCGVDATIARAELTSFGATPNWTGRRADGTGASPSAVQSGDVLAAFNAHGYNGSAWTATAAASIELIANQNWTTAAEGTHIDIKTVPNGSLVSALAVVCRFENDGGVTCPNGASGGDQGAGTINVSGGYYIGGSGITGFTGTGTTGVRATAPSISSLTVTTAFTATGLVTNADLANASTTVNGQTCTLGSTCVITASAGSITYGTTTAGTSIGIPYNTSNGGALSALTPVSGAILYGASATTPAFSALLTQYGPIYGGGAGAAPVAMAAGTNGQIIVGQTSAAPLWKTAGGDVASISAAGAFTLTATNTNLTTLANVTTVGALAAGSIATGFGTILTTNTIGTAADTITSASATALAVGINGATNPAFNVDASTALQAAGLNVKGAVTGGTVAVSLIDSGSNTNLTINAKGSGTIGIGNISTGAVTVTPNTVFGGTITAASLGTGTQTQCLGLTSGNVIVPVTGSCGTSSGTVTAISQGANTTANPGAGVNLSTNPCTSSCTVTVDASYLRGYISGCTLSNDGTTPNTVIDIAVCVATSDDATTLMKVASAYTKNMNAAWAVGSTNGCADGTGYTTFATFGGTPTWVHIFEIIRTDTGVTDYLCSKSATAPTLPTGYGKQRRLGAVKIDATPKILQFQQTAMLFTWQVPVLDVNSVPCANTAQTGTLSVPLGVVVEAVINAQAVGGTGTANTDIWVHPLYVTSATPQFGSPGFTAGDPSTTSLGAAADASVLTNTSQGVGWISNRNTSGSICNIVTRGWRESL